jgi:hypothetical protein
MAKKTIVTSILMTGVPPFAATYFRVGTVPLNATGVPCTVPGDADTPAFPAVSEIISCRDRFGGGAQIDQPCYVVKFEGSPESVIIPATQYCQATVAIVDPDEPHTPNLPE